MRYHGVRGNVSSTSSAVDIDDRFDVLVDSNDQLLERVVCPFILLLILLHFRIIATQS